MGPPTLPCRYGDEGPTLRGARGGGPRWDDPYTIILTRDTVEQTFSRSDVRRELRDIRVVPSDDESAAPS